MQQVHGSEREDQRSTATRGCRIVIVDDQADSSEMLRTLLEARDHVVFEAPDGPSAVELIARVQPDIAFIDIALPMMNGYEVVCELRAHHDVGRTLLVALTGYNAPSDIARAREVGFDEHLVKPARMAQIEAVIAKALAR